MSEKILTEADIFSPVGYDWSIRLGRFGRVTGGGRDVRHYFLLLVEDQDADTNPDRILHELHFKAVDREKGWGQDFQRGYIDALRPDVKLLGAESYVKIGRSLSEIETLNCAHGLPWDMLHIWNCMMHVGIAIDNLRHPFDEEHNCCTGAQAVVETLGLPVPCFADTPSRPVPVKFGMEINSSPVPPASDGEKLLGDFRRLHDVLEQRRVARCPDYEKVAACEPN